MRRSRRCGVYRLPMTGQRTEAYLDAEAHRRACRRFPREKRMKLRRIRDHAWHDGTEWRRGLWRYTSTLGYAPRRCAKARCRHRSLWYTHQDYGAIVEVVRRSTVFMSPISDLMVRQRPSLIWREPPRTPAGTASSSGITSRAGRSRRLIPGWRSLRRRWSRHVCVWRQR